MFQEYSEGDVAVLIKEVQDAAESVRPGKKAAVQKLLGRIDSAMSELKEVLRREPVSGESQGEGALVEVQDQGEGALVEVQEPDVTHQDKKRKVEPQRSQDGEAIAVDLTGEGDVEVFKARGELGKGFGALGGRPLRRLSFSTVSLQSFSNSQALRTSVVTGR